MFEAIDLIDLLGSLALIAWISPTNSWVLIRMIREKLLSCHTFVINIGLIRLFLNSLHFAQINTKRLWNLHIGASGMNAKQYSMPFPNFWWSELCYGTAFLTDCAWLTLVWCRVDKTWHKQNAWMKLIIQNGNNLPITPYIYIYICVCVWEREYIYIYIYRYRNMTEKYEKLISNPSKA